MLALAPIDFLEKKTEGADFFRITLEKKENDLPITWAYPNYSIEGNLLDQGFKLHISVTILNAEQIFDLAVPFLLKNKNLFKVIGTFFLLRKLNDGQLGFTQVGKFITIYPSSTEKAVQLAHQLDKILSGFEAPFIPSDKQLHPNSIIYYRYGKFKKDKDQKGPDMLILPNGQQIEDNRDPRYPIPKGMVDPFNPVDDDSKNSKNLLAERFIVLKVLRQVAKGGVYLALDINPTNQFKKSEG